MGIFLLDLFVLLNIIKAVINMKKINLTEEQKQVIKKLIISVLVIGAIILVIYLIMHWLGITDLTREELQEIIQSTGAIAPLTFIGISFLQVTFVPIPGMITILAGSYVFGAWESFLYSYIGMNLGAIVAFALGRLIGKPYINWVAGGEDKAKDWIKRLNGKEKIFLFFAFLFPFFPDDLLCSIAGALPITWRTFILMQLVTRTTSIGGTLLFMSGEVIPYEGWGLVLIGFFILLGVLAFIVSLKYSDQINAWFDKFTSKLSKKSKEKTNKN